MTANFWDSIISMEMNMSVSTAKRVAFRVEASDQVDPGNAPIKFHQMYNIGSGSYDPTTGIYTIGTSGVYSFQYQLWNPDQNDFLMDLYINGGIQVWSSYFSSSMLHCHCNQWGMKLNTIS